MEKQTKTIWNVPNVLSLLRMILVPVCMAAILYMPVWCEGIDNEVKKTLLICIVPTAIFGITSLTDMLDGKIARKYNLVSDFGKFLDPLADKYMIFGMLVAILVSSYYIEIRPLFVWMTAIVMLRELGVTSLRLVVASRGVVVAANFFGKAKTVTQIASLILILMEPAMFLLFDSTSFIVTYHPIAYFAMIATIITTVGSGVNYFVQLWPYINGRK